MNRFPFTAEELAERLQAALEQYGFIDAGHWVLPFECIVQAMLPEELCDAIHPTPDGASDAPGGAPERLQQMIDRAEAASGLTVADRDREAAERVAAMVENDRKARRDSRKHYQVVVETTEGTEVEQERDQG
jgi:hypothetical protein